ncbi:hypothetical protein [Agrobacterium cavarae]|uniref:hypothetical protein n=1 Tax=Agrobacterium cavarae TaxID=2528239 RepID=UPI0028A7429D|nr:hypothetical protein [Agrobacterium cavarae]
MATAPASDRVHPRISVNDLALFMVSSDTARMGIIRRAKSPQKAPMIRYKDARAAICAYLSDPVRNIRSLAVAETMLQQRHDDPATSPLLKDDASHSIQVLQALRRMGNQLAQYDFHSAPKNQSKLNIAGVEISVRADLLVQGVSRSAEQIGTAILRMTMDDADNESARERRRNMGLFVATLARLHTEHNISSNREPANRLCLSIDIQHGEVFVAPNANSRRVNDIENACRTIAAIWPSL